MSLRCTNCGAPLVLPVPAPPLVSCSYCLATIAIAPQFQAHSVAPPAPPRARGVSKLWYALGGALLVAGGALIGPPTQLLTSSPSASPSTAATTDGGVARERDAAPATNSPAGVSAPAVTAPAATVAIVVPNQAARPAAVDPTRSAPTSARPASAPALGAPSLLPTPIAATPSPAPTPTSTPAPTSVPRSVRVSMGSPSIVGANPGNHDVAAVRRVLPHASSPVRACYQQALADHPDAAGSLSMSFQIEEDGSVAGAGVTGSFLPSNLAVGVYFYS